MGNKNVIYNLIRELSVKHNLYKITTESLKNYAKTKINTATDNGIVMTTADLQGIDETLKELEKEGRVQLEYIGTLLHRVVYVNYFIDTVKWTYEKMKKDFHVPFPTPEMFKQEIPPEQVIAVDVKKEFVSWLEKENLPKDKILRLVLPQFEFSMLAMPEMLKERLLIASIDKVACFFEKESNFDYIQSRMITVLKNDVPQVKKMIADIRAKEAHIYQSLLNPTAFTFAFWSHLATSIIKEYQTHNTAYSGDYVYAQASFLIGFYNVYYKGRNQKNSDKESAHEKFLVLMKKEPYCFSLNDFYNFKDDNGTPLVKICGKEDFNQYIQKLISEVDATSLPLLALIKTDTGREFFIARDIFARYLLKQLSDISQAMKVQIEDDWKASLENYQKLPEMKHEADFEKMLKKRLRDHYPVILAMLDYGLIMKMLVAGVIKEAQRLELSAVLDESEGRLHPYASILKLNRLTLYADVKILLPVFKSNSLFRAITQFFARLFTGRKRPKKHPRKQLEFTKVSSDDMSLALSKIKEDIFGEQVDSKETMDDLIQQWNPLIDKVAKANLIEDVNNMLKDYVRKFKASFSVAIPTRERVEVMAERLSENNAFAQIKNKEALRKYMVLFIIETLNAMKLFK